MDISDQYSSLITDGGSGFQTDYHNETPVQAIARALSALENCSVQDIPPIYRYTDPDALNRLMQRACNSDQEVNVEMTIEDYNITVDSDGTISISDPGGCFVDGE